MGVALVVAGVRGSRIDSAAGGEALQHLLVVGPETLRLDEGLVVEARADERTDELVRRADVEASDGQAFWAFTTMPELTRR